MERAKLQDLDPKVKDQLRKKIKEQSVTLYCPNPKCKKKLSKRAIRSSHGKQVKCKNGCGTTYLIDASDFLDVISLVEKI